MPKHIINLLVLLGGFLLLAFVVRFYLVDPSYYKYGTYRGDAVTEIAALTTVHRTSAHCQTCHEKRFAEWSVGGHQTVQCEVCHGVTPDCPDNPDTRIPADKIKLCTRCHEELPARPAAQPQIVLGEHPFPGEETPQCHTCHDPHLPPDMQVDAATPETQAGEVDKAGASIEAPAVTTKCGRCHGKQGEGRKRNPPLAGLEPAVFVERMNLYLTGVREHKIMAKFAKSLSDEEIEELARYYASLPAVPDE